MLLLIVVSVVVVCVAAIAADVFLTFVCVDLFEGKARLHCIQPVCFSYAFHGMPLKWGLLDGIVADAQASVSQVEPAAGAPDASLTASECSLDVFDMQARECVDVEALYNAFRGVGDAGDDDAMVEVVAARDQSRSRSRSRSPRPRGKSMKSDNDWGVSDSGDEPGHDGAGISVAAQGGSSETESESDSGSSSTLSSSSHSVTEAVEEQADSVRGEVLVVQAVDDSAAVAGEAAEAASNAWLVSDSDSDGPPPGLVSPSESDWSASSDSWSDSDAAADVESDDDAEEPKVVENILNGEMRAAVQAAVEAPSPRRPLWRKGSLTSQEDDPVGGSAAAVSAPVPAAETPTYASASRTALEHVCVRLRQNNPILVAADQSAAAARPVQGPPLVRRSLVAGGALDHTKRFVKPARWPVGAWWAERLWNVMESLDATKAPARPVGLELQCAGLAGEVFATSVFFVLLNICFDKSH